MQEELHPLMAAREARNLTQAQLAEAVGLGPRTIWAAEHNIPISANSRRLLCRYFKQSVQELGLVKSESKTRQRKQQKRIQQYKVSLMPQTQSLPVTVQSELTPSIIIDSSIHTSSLLLRVMMVLYQYQRTSYGDLQRVIDQQIGKYDLMKQPGDHEESKLSRRDALVMIAGLPLALLVKKPLEPMATAFAEDFLAQCAASMTACWHLMRGNQLSVVDEVLQAYLPILETLAQQPSKYQSAAANLAAQGYRINGILALHRNNLREREVYCQQAVRYGELAGDASLLVSAFISLASTFYYGQDPIKAARIYQQALVYQGNIPPLLLARVYVELAVVYAQQRQEQEALRYMCLAQERYPEYPEADPSFLYAEFSPSSMILEEGLTHLALAHHYPDGQYSHQAWNAFARIEQVKTPTPVPERIRIEIINHQATTALALKDVDAFCDRLEQGVNGAKRLGSERRRQEAIEVYKNARKIWPNEARVRELADLFV